MARTKQVMRPYPATRRAAANAEAGQQGSSSSAAADPSSSLDDTVVMPSGGKKALNTGNSDAKWIMGDEDDQSSVSVRSGPAVQNDRGFYEDREGLPAKPAGSSGMSLREMHALSTAKWQAIAQMRADDISEDIESWREQGIYLNHHDYDDIDGLMGKLVTGLEAKERFKAAKKKGAKKGKQASKAQQQRRGIKQENRIGKGIQPTRYNQGGMYQPQAVPRAYGAYSSSSSGYSSAHAQAQAQAQQVQAAAAAAASLGFSLVPNPYGYNLGLNPGLRHTALASAAYGALPAPVSPPPPPPPARSFNGAFRCIFYNLPQGCRNGASCPFGHDTSYGAGQGPPPSTTSRFKCLFYTLPQGCRNGINCPFGHDASSSGAPHASVAPAGAYRCLFYNLPQGCYNGDNCPFVHDPSFAPHPDDIRMISKRGHLSPPPF